MVNSKVDTFHLQCTYHNSTNGGFNPTVDILIKLCLHLASVTSTNLPGPTPCYTGLKLMPTSESKTTKSFEMQLSILQGISCVLFNLIDT